MYVIGFAAYVAVIMSIVGVVYRQMAGQDDYETLVLGKRSMSYWLTALSAHASDMSDWLFMAFPAAIFAGGMLKSWIGIGLVVGMFCVWQWVAPRLRQDTETVGSVTLSSFFEKRFNLASDSLITLLNLLFIFIFLKSYFNFLSKVFFEKTSTVIYSL